MNKHAFKKIVGEKILQAQSYKIYESTKPKILLAFHGFGQDANVFNKITKQFPNTIIYSFDLFNHGESNWQGSNLKYYPETFKRELENFFKVEEIVSFDVIAFSMGSRLALATAAFFPESLNKLILIAPDGIYENFWFKFSTRNRIGNSIFRLVIQNEKGLLAFIDVFGNLKLVNKKLVQLTKKVIHYNSLKKIFNTWMLYSLFTFNTKQVFGKLFSDKKEIYLVTGAYDEVISKEKLYSVLKRNKVFDESFLVNLPVSHQKLLHHFINSPDFKAIFSR